LLVLIHDTNTKTKIAAEVKAEIFLKVFIVFYLRIVEKVYSHTLYRTFIRIGLLTNTRNYNKKLNTTNFN